MPLNLASGEALLEGWATSARGFSALLKRGRPEDTKGFTFTKPPLIVNLRETVTQTT